MSDHYGIPVGCQEEETVVMTGVSRETYEKIIHMFDNIPVTNFDKVTESPEALAEWLDNTFDYCQAIWHWQCDKCTWSKKNESCVGDKEKWLEWLNGVSTDD